MSFVILYCLHCCLHEDIHLCNHCLPKGDIVKQPMKKGSFVPKNVPGVGWVGHEGVGWGGVCHIGVGWGGS